MKNKQQQIATKEEQRENKTKPSDKHDQHLQVFVNNCKRKQQSEKG
jgi:hypothetical protein